MHISQKVKGVNVTSSTYYFHMKAKMLADFQICISVPLTAMTTNNNKHAVADRATAISQ